MRLLPSLLLACSVVVSASACNKAPGSGAGSNPSGPSDAAAASAAAADTVAMTPPSLGARASFDTGFEGGLVMHATTPHGTTDMLFVTKGGKLRADVPGKDGRTAHTVLDPASGKLTIIMDSQQLAMQMPIPHGAAGGVSKPSRITRTGKHETIAGYDCEDWEIVTEGGNHSSTCVAQGLPFFDFSALAGPTSGHTWADELREKNAFPLRAVEVDAAGKEISRMEVTKVEKRPVDDSAFTIPSNFHLIEVPGGAVPITQPGRAK